MEESNVVPFAAITQHAVTNEPLSGETVLHNAVLSLSLFLNLLQSVFLRFRSDFGVS